MTMNQNQKKPSFASIAAIGTSITINPLPVAEPVTVRNTITEAVNSDDLKRRVHSTAKASSGFSNLSSSSSSSSTAASSDTNSTTTADGSPSSSSRSSSTPVSIPKSAPIPKKNAWNTDAITTSIETSPPLADLPTPAESKDMKSSAPAVVAVTLDAAEPSVPNVNTPKENTASKLIGERQTTKRAPWKMTEDDNSHVKPLRSGPKNSSDGNHTSRNSTDAKNPDANVLASKSTNISAKQQPLQNEKSKTVTNSSHSKPVNQRKDNNNTKSISPNIGTQPKKKTFHNNKDTHTHSSTNFSDNSKKLTKSNDGRTTKKSNSQSHHGKNHNNNKTKKSNNNQSNNNNQKKSNKAKKQNKRKSKARNNKQKEMQPYIPTPEEYEAFKKSTVMQVEYFFSADELVKNVYLRKQMDVEGFLPAAIVFNFPSILSHCIPYYDLLEAIEKHSEVIEVDMVNECLRVKDKDNYKRWLFPNGDGTFGVAKWIKDVPVEEEQQEVTTDQKGDEGLDAIEGQSNEGGSSEKKTDVSVTIDITNADASKGDPRDLNGDQQPELTMTDSDTDSSQ